MSISELSITRLLANELENQGIKVNTEMTYPIATGGLVKPDISLLDHHAGVEAKLGDHGRFVEAMGQLWRLQKAGLRGGFVVIFDEKLKQKIRDLREAALEADNEAYVFLKDGATSLRFRGGLGEVAAWIKSQLEQPPVEADISATIDVLRKAVNFLAESLKTFSGKMFEDIFGGKTVFENILQYGEGEYPAESMRSAAAYLLVNQILFYHSLSATDSKKFPVVDEEALKRPRDVIDWFANALSVDYQAVFSFDVASRLPLGALGPLRTIIGAIKLLGPERIKHDFLGQIFHDMIPLEVRKPVAAFYTNVYAAELLANLAVRKADDKVIDLAVGSGGLLVASYRAKRRLAGPSFTEKDHKEFVEQELTGIDIMPFAAHLATVNLSLQAPLYQTNKVRIAVWDSTELKPGQEIPPVSRILRERFRRPTLDAFAKGEGVSLADEAYIKRGAYTLEGDAKEQIPISKVDIVIMNPPFTRAERFPISYKEELDKRFYDYKDCLHGQLGYYGYFLLLADMFLKQDGRLALVLPATILRVRSTAGVRKFLLRNYHVEFLISTLQRAAFSESAEFREVLLVAKKVGVAKDLSEPPCKMVMLKRLPASTEEALQVSERIREVQAFEDDRMVIQPISQDQLREHADNMFVFVAGNPNLTAFWNRAFRLGRTRVTPFSLYLRSVKGGKIIGGLGVTGTAPDEKDMHGVLQSLFVLTKEAKALKKSDVWVAETITHRAIVARNRHTHRKMQLPRKALRPTLRRLSRVPSLDVTHDLDFLVVSQFNGFSEFLREGTGRTSRVC